MTYRKPSYDLFFEEIPAAGVEENSPAPEVQPSVEISAEATPAPGSEAVTNPVEEPKQTVPFERFQEVNNELKELRQKVDGITKVEPEVTEEPVQLDPEVSTMLEGWAKSQGFVRQSDIQAERAAEQAQKDLTDVKTQYKLSDTELEAVRAEAVAAGAANRKGLENAYFRLNMDKIVEAKVKEALAGGGAPAVAEKPGVGNAATPPAAEQQPGMSIKDRIRAASGS